MEQRKAWVSTQNLSKQITNAMKFSSKRLQALETLIGPKTYSLDEALSMVKEIGTAKFVESVEAHVSLNISPKYANQQLRANLVLPHGTGKQLRLAVLTEASLVSEAMELGATLAGAEDLIEKISQGKIQFDVLITTPQQMPKLAKLGRVLGPKGLMPSPKSGTITQNLKQTLDEFRKGKLDYRADKNGIVHLNFGKVTFSEAQLKENLLSLYTSIEKNKPAGVKGKYFKSFHICTTMSPALKLDLKK